MVVVALFFFFFQAEDGIRDWSVTGVQTCALPIYDSAEHRRAGEAPIAKELDDPLVSRLALELLPLADVDAHEHALTLESMHGRILPRVHQSADRPVRPMETNRPATPMPRAQARSARTTLETI